MLLKYRNITKQKFHILLKFIKNPEILLYVILFFCLFILFLYFEFTLNLSSNSLFFKVCSALADSSILLLLCSLFKGKFKIIILFFPYIISILLIANLLYFRNFSDLIPSSLYSLSWINDSLIINSAFNSIKLSDVVLLLIPLLPTIYYSLNRKKIRTIYESKNIIIFFLVITLFFEVITITGAFRRQKIYNNHLNFVELFHDTFPPHFTAWSFWYLNHNFMGYIIKIISNVGTQRHPLSSEELKVIQSYIKSDNEFRFPTIHENLCLNLIFIVVESLPYKVFEMNDSLIAPNLYSIFHNPNVFITKSKVLAKYGRSSDAQFIYNTGLLPLRTEPLVSKYAYNNYPSIAKALKITSTEVIGENGALWSHNITTESYGFTNLISDLAYNKVNQDSIIFKEAFINISEQKERFFTFITTLSMHNPYNSSNVTIDENITYPIDISDSRDKEYINRLYHFDKSLGNFLQNLKNINIFENSLIVIIGDHEISKEDISAQFWDTYVPFIIINSPRKLYNSLPCTQLDVFPTLLDLLNIEYEYLGIPYRGLGTSLTKQLPSKFVCEKDYEISERIITSNIPFLYESM